MTADRLVTRDAPQRPHPTLYTFRRCPFAMRARMALCASGQTVSLREIVLRDKPDEMVAISPKATVPVLHLKDGSVLEESLSIMDWALNRNDPARWLSPETGTVEEMHALISECDGRFKHHLDRYKYSTRYEAGTDPVVHRTKGAEFLSLLDKRLQGKDHLFGNRPCLADIAIFPFVRQFANTDRAWFDAQPLPQVHIWLDWHLNSDDFQKVMEKWKVWSPGAPEPLFPA